MGPRIPRKPGQPAKSKKHSDLYTDEDPKGTIHGLGFKTPDKAKESVSKIKKSSRSHNHKTQAAISMEQRAKVMGKSKAAGIYRKFIDSQKAKTKEMKEESMENAPSIKDKDAPHKKIKKTPVKNYPGLGIAPTINEVAPPGFGHTKGDDKGGTAAAFDRARKEGRFKGSKSDMFAIMWSQKKKGDKPHYKPGTDRKYKKYEEQLDALLTDPLEELWELYEAVMPKPDLASPIPSNVEGPNKRTGSHPVTKKRRDVDELIDSGMEPAEAHQAIHGEIKTNDIESKGKLAATLGRLQDDGINNGIKIEKDTGSLLARDAIVNKQLDQVTDDDLRTPMNQQVPDDEQTPQDQVAEQLDLLEEVNYNDDVAYLQKYGRA